MVLELYCKLQIRRELLALPAVTIAVHLARAVQYGSKENRSETHHDSSSSNHQRRTPHSHPSSYGNARLVGNTPSLHPAIPGSLGTVNTNGGGGHTSPSYIPSDAIINSSLIAELAAINNLLIANFKENNRMTVKPFHSKNCVVYHTQSKCGAANEIPYHDQVQGKGGYRQCKNRKKMEQD